MVHFQVPRVCLWLINMCCHSNGFHTDGGLRHIFRSHEFPRAWLINMCRHSNGFHTDGGLRHIFRSHEFLWLWLFTPPLKKKNAGVSQSSLAERIVCRRNAAIHLNRAD
jgi:hypothetical protein